MRNLLSKLWKDDAGFLISTELLFLCVILVIGLIAGWSQLRGALLTEFGELAEAIASLNESYYIADVSMNSGAMGITLGQSGGVTVIDTAPGGTAVYSTQATVLNAGQLGEIVSIGVSPVYIP